VTQRGPIAFRGTEFTDAAAAVAALGIFRHDQMLRERISDIVRRRDEPKISRSFEAAFDL